MALDSYQEKNNRSVHWRRVAVPDDLILRYSDIFTNLHVYHLNFEQPGDKLNYYGKTIIPPHSVKELRSRIDTLSAWGRIKLFPLKRTLDYAVRNGMFVVHIGI